MQHQHTNSCTLLTTLASQPESVLPLHFHPTLVITPNKVCLLQLFNGSTSVCVCFLAVRLLHLYGWLGGWNNPRHLFGEEVSKVGNGGAGLGFLFPGPGLCSHPSALRSTRWLLMREWCKGRGSLMGFKVTVGPSPLAFSFAVDRRFLLLMMLKISNSTTFVQGDFSIYEFYTFCRVWCMKPRAKPFQPRCSSHVTGQLNMHGEPWSCPYVWALIDRREGKVLLRQHGQLCLLGSTATDSYAFNRIEQGELFFTNAPFESPPITLSFCW